MITISIVAIYSRKSKFTGKGNSIQNQIELCKEYAKKHFITEKFLIFEDEGYSGGNTDRPMYKKMLEDAKNHKFDILVCYRLDRISRNISDFSYIVDLLKDNNIDFVSIRENFDTSTPMGRAMMFIASVFAQLERETISERIKDNMYHLAKSGRWLGGKTPIGFESKKIEYFDDSNNKKSLYMLTPISKELELVKNLYIKYLSLNSLTKLESWALENNIKTRSNNSFEKSTLSFILSNPVYAIADKKMYQYFSLHDCKISNTKDEFNGMHGLMVYNKHDEKKNKIVKKDKSEWIVAIALHEGIISSEDWIKVQKLLEKNKKKSPRTGSSKIGLITNILKCKNCGSKMRITASHRKNRIYYYYKCLKKEKSNGLECSINNLNGKCADKLVIDELKKLGFNKKVLYNHFNKIMKNLSLTISNDSNNILMLENNIQYYESCISNLTLKLSETENSSASKYIINQIEDFDKKIINSKNKIKNYRCTDLFEIENNNIKEILNLIANFKNNINNLSFEEKKKLIITIIDEITWDGTTLTINIHNN